MRTQRPWASSTFVGRGLCVTRPLLSCRIDGGYKRQRSSLILDLPCLNGRLEGDRVSGGGGKCARASCSATNKAIAHGLGVTRVQHGSKVSILIDTVVAITVCSIPFRCSITRTADSAAASHTPSCRAHAADAAAESTSSVGTERRFVLCCPCAASPVG